MSNKKLIAIVLAGFLLLAVIASVTILIVKHNLAKTDSSGITNTRSVAETKKSQAIQAENNNETTKALQFYKEAKAEYEKSGSSNDVIDMEAKIYLLENK